MQQTAILDRLLWLPQSALRPSEVASLRSNLTIPADPKIEGDVDMEMYDLQSRPGYIGVPRAFGLHNFSHFQVQDRRSLGQPIGPIPRLPDPNHPRVLEPIKQAKFMADMEQQTRLHHGLIGMAGTGTGKTVTCLRTAVKLGRNLLVFLHLGRLLDQWKEEAASKLGLHPSQIGEIRQDVCDYIDKPVTVAMLHSFWSRGIGGRNGYPEELRDYFGTVAYDEVHKAATGQFEPVVGMFNSYYRIGLTATPERTDGMERVFFYHIGPIRVVSEAKAAPCEVHTLDYVAPPNFVFWGNDPSARNRCLALDHNRNILLAKMVKRFYDTGRNALIVGEQVLHVQKIMDMAEQLGVPREAMGQFTGDYQEVTNDRDPHRPNKRKIRKTKVSKEELKRAKTQCQLTFATYGMVTEGIDEPRWDAGLDLVPRGSATQLIGRIRRPLEGKPLPKWVTVRDKRCPISMHQYWRRCKDYRKSGARIVLNGEVIRPPRTGTLAARAQSVNAIRARA